MLLNTTGRRLQAVADAKRAVRDAMAAEAEATKAYEKVVAYRQQCVAELNAELGALCPVCDGYGYTTDGRRAETTCHRCGGKGAK